MINIKGIVVVGLFMLPGFSEAQVSIYTEPDSDTIVFEDYTGTVTMVTPSYPGAKITIDNIYGDSTYIVSPGGHYTNTFEVDNDE